MSLRRIDVLAIAEAVTKARERAEHEDADRALDSAAETLADYCESRLPRFDRERFLRDCGVRE